MKPVRLYLYKIHIFVQYKSLNNTLHQINIPGMIPTCQFPVVVRELSVEFLLSILVLLTYCGKVRSQTLKQGPTFMVHTNPFVAVKKCVENTQLLKWNSG